MSCFSTHLQLSICQCINIPNKGSFTHPDEEQLLTDDKQQGLVGPKGTKSQLEPE